MSLSFTGPSGTAEHRWIVYALMRDNVQHHLENVPSSPGEFESIHRIEQALGGTPVMLSAQRLRGELEAARGLLPRPIRDLAVSERTRSVIDRSWPAPREQARDTILAEGNVSIAWISPNARTLDEVFGNLVRSLLAITKDARENDVVEVYDS